MYCLTTRSPVAWYPMLFHHFCTRLSGVSLSTPSSPPLKSCTLRILAEASSHTHKYILSYMHTYTFLSPILLLLKLVMMIGFGGCCVGLACLCDTESNVKGIITHTNRFKWIKSTFQTLSFMSMYHREGRRGQRSTISGGKVDVVLDLPDPSR